MNGHDQRLKDPRSQAKLLTSLLRTSISYLCQEKPRKTRRENVLKFGEEYDGFTFRFESLTKRGVSVVKKRMGVSHLYREEATEENEEMQARNWCSPDYEGLHWSP